MASNGRVEIEITANDSDLQKKLDAIAKMGKGSADELANGYKKASKAIEDANKKVKKSVQEATQSNGKANTAPFNEVKAAAEDAEQALNDAKNAGENLGDGVADGANEAVNSLEDIKDAAQDVTRAMRKTSEDAGAGIGSKLVSGTKTALHGLKVGTTATFHGIAKATPAIVKSVTAISAAAGAASAFITKVGGDFQTAFAQVQTIMDPTQKSIEDMKKEIMALSDATGVAATDLSGSVYNAISATGDTANSVNLVGSAVKLAKAGFTDTESALGVLTTAMNAYGLSAEEALNISDSLIQTQNLGVTTIADLSSVMGKAIASASAYKINLANVESSYISMTKAGISTQESTTYMSSMFKELGDSGSAVAKTLKQQTGKTFSEMMESGMDVADALGAIYTALGEDSTAMMNLWSSAEAGKAANAIISQGLENFKTNLDAVQNSAGLTENAYATMANTVQHQTETLKNNVKNLAIDIFEGYSPQIAGLMGDINGWMEQLSSAYKSGGMAAAGDAASAIAPQLITKLSSLMQKAAGALAKQLPGLVKNLVGIIPQLIGSASEFVPDLTDALFDALAAGVEGLAAQLPTLLPMLLKGLGSLFVSVVEGAADVLRGLVNGLLGNIPIEYKSFGSVPVELEYEVSEKATILSDTATTTVETRISEFKEEIKGMGLTDEDLAVLLAYNGSEENLRSMLAEKYPDLTSTQVDAIVEKMGGMTDQTGAFEAAAREKLGAIGLDDQTIADIIGYKESGDEESLKRLLKEKMPSNMYGTAMDAINQAWEESKTINPAGSSGAVSGNFLADMIEDMFTNGAGETAEDQAALSSGVQQMIDAKKQAIMDYIAETGDVEGGEAALQSWDALAQGIMTYISTYGNATAEECAAGMQMLRDLAAEADTSLEKIRANTEEAISLSQKKFELGAGGAKLTHEDTLSALAFVKNDYDNALKLAETQRDNFIKTLSGTEDENTQALEDFDQKTFYPLLDEAERLRNARLQAFLEGQAKVLDVDVGGNLEFVVALNEIRKEFMGELENGRPITSAQVEEKLKEKGYSPEVIETAMSELFGNLQWNADAGLLFEGNEDLGLGEELNAQLLKAISDSLGGTGLAATAAQIQGIVAQYAEQNGLDGTMLVNTVMQSLFGEGQRGTYELNQVALEMLISQVNLGGLGDTLATITQNGLLEGVEGADKMNANELFLHILASDFGNLDPLDFANLSGAQESGKAAGEETANAARTGVQEGLSSAEGTDEKFQIKAKPEVVVEDSDSGSVEQQAEMAKAEAESTLTDSATGEPVKLVQNAYVDLNVTATVSGTDFSAAGANAGLQFAQALSTTDTTGAAQSLVNGAITGLKNGGKYASTLGRSFAQGYAQGIDSGKNAAIAAAARLAAAAMRSVKNTQRSASPSKEAMQLGGYFGQGYTIGLEESMQQAVDVARRTTRDVLNASVLGATGAGVIRVETGREPINVNVEGSDRPINLDGKQIASIQSDNNSGALAWRNFSQSRGMGGR